MRTLKATLALIVTLLALVLVLPVGAQNYVWSAINGIPIAPGLRMSGNLLFAPDNTYDIGASGANRPKNLYVSGSGTFTGTVGALHDATGGILGVGAAAQPGYGLYLDTGTSNITGTPSTRNEVVGAAFTANNTPTSATANSTGVFGLLAWGTWAGSADSVADGLVYGIQSTAYLSGTASVRRMHGVEATVLTSHTAGTAATAWGLWAHISNSSTGLMTDGEAVRVDVNGSGITNGVGLRVGTIQGANAYGIKMNDVTQGTSTNYAIYTGLGPVRFGDAVSAPSLTVSTLYSAAGAVSVGDDTTAIASLLVRGKTAQTENLLDLKINGVSKFSVSAAGSVSFINDLNFSTYTAIFGAAQDTRIYNLGVDFASSRRVAWSSTAAAYDTKDTGLSRSAAGVVEVNNGTAGTFRDLKVRALTATTFATVGSHATITVDGATTFAASSSYLILACTGAETINTITGITVAGTILYLENTDTDCTIADDDAPTAANAINLTGSADDVGAAEKVLTLIFDGNAFLELSESDN